MKYFRLVSSLSLFPNRSLSGRKWHIKDASAKNLTEFVRDKKINDAMPERSVPLAPPDLFPAIARACERTKQAFARKETIGIFGDYDCDGVSGTAILFRLCSAHGTKPFVRLPHREHEGYGLSLAHVEEIKQAGVTLLLTVDTGITAVAPIAAAKAAGIDTIVLDHHSVPQELPDAFAILHPALAPSYPLPHPCGAGVALSFREAVEGGSWNDMDEDIALAAIATVADLVPLHGGNRALVKRGLQILQEINAGPLALL
ncbi:MAG TPA: DHH family phosphoesterase, partial [Candidatus Peribacteraceae bacterium]|nr:DHH family phosphoesterase [Candidatus Peribacteraceae bacterium]